MRPMPLLSGKKALITGGSRSLGRAICEAFAREGAEIAFTYSSDEKGAAETRARVEAIGTKCSVFKASVTDEAATAQVVTTLESEWLAIDILVNNAGASQALPIALMDEADWDAIVDVNLKGTYLVSRRVVQGMIRRRSGTILNIGSLAGCRLLEAPIHYCAAKAGVKAFTEALSKEVARYGVRVNCLAPGLLEEGVAENLPDHKLKGFLDQVALNRRGTLAEVARFATFLVSSRNSYMNGATVVLDGGL